MRFGSLFSGIGGIDLGLEMAGMECAFQVEIDPFANQVLEKHWPDVKRYLDIRELNDPPKCDVLAGGFPCQDVSQARHNGLGVGGAKSGLWNEFKRLIEQMRPPYVIIENVEALRYAGRGLDKVLLDLAEIGYNAEWIVFGAAHVGAPHKRSRIWVVAYPNGNGKSNLCIHDEARFLQELGKVNRGWAAFTEALRVDDGVSRGMDRRRLKALGNAVVPAAARLIGELVIRHHEQNL